MAPAEPVTPMASAGSASPTAPTGSVPSGAASATTVRLSLVAPAVNTALREARFDDSGPVEPVGRGPLAVSAGTLVLRSPSGRCRATAEALGLPDVPAEEALAGCAMGRWQGRTLAEIAAEDAESTAAWLSDPAAAPHGGESLRELRARVGAWVAGLEPGRVLVFAEPDVIRAAVAHALGAPEEVFWRLDVRPLQCVELSGRSGRWNLRLGAPLR
ncbi:histidine phosphatase family protein [Streptomyces roseicoloratus]|uniref:histidine phosphatase family protein n=1 Tax=Streptomyces roseicoloratus TaxID=2508722 RepID=UPI001FEA6214|nr:histidine phosphatase family protein [Streptomyces roseicoloratus]